MARSNSEDKRYIKIMVTFVRCDTEDISKRKKVTFVRCDTFGLFLVAFQKRIIK